MANFTKAERKRRSKRMKAYWKNVAPEKRALHCKRISQSWDDPKVRYNRTTKRAEAWSNLSPQQKKTRLAPFLKSASKKTPKQIASARYLLTGPQNPRWKGGIKISKQGYVMLLMPGHPNAYGWTDSKTGKKVRARYIFEHRYVMSQILGRPLDRYDIIHHINGNRADNRPENLEHLRGDNIGTRKPIICPKCNHAF